MTPVPGGEGLQHERTALAWQRTAIAAVVVLLPLLLVDARLGAWPLVVLGGCRPSSGWRWSAAPPSGSATCTAATSAMSATERRDHPAGESSSPWPPMRAVALVATLAAAGAVATALTVALS